MNGYYARAMIYLSENVREGIWKDLRLKKEHRLGSTFVHEARHVIDRRNIWYRRKAEELWIVPESVREVEEGPMRDMVRMLQEMSVKPETCLRRWELEEFEEAVSEWLENYTKPLRERIRESIWGIVWKMVRRSVGLEDEVLYNILGIDDAPLDKK